MAIGVNSHADRLVRTANRPATSTWSFCIAFRLNLTIANGAFAEVFSWDDGSGEWYQIGITGNAGGTDVLEFYNTVSPAISTGVDVRAGKGVGTNGDWFFVGVAVGGGSLRYHLRNLTTMSAAVTGTGTYNNRSALSNDTIYIGSSGFTEFWTGHLAGARLWDATLNAAQLEAEESQAAAVLTTNLNAEWQLVNAATALDDTGPNNRDLAAPGAESWTDETGPWSSSTTYDETPADTVVSVDSTTWDRQMNYSPADTIISVDALTAAESMAVSPADTIVSSDSTVWDLQMNYAPADTLVVADSITHIQNMVHSQADSASGADSGTHTQVMGHTPADTIVSSDAVTETKSVDFILADTLISSDSSTHAQVMAATPTDTIMSVDALTHIQSMVASPTDTISSLDVLAHIQTMAGIYADVIVSVDEGLASFAEARSLLLRGGRLVLNAITPGPVSLFLQDNPLQVGNGTEYDSNYDLLLRNGRLDFQPFSIFQETITETVVGSDAATLRVFFRQSVSEIGTVIDTATATKFFRQTILESGLVLDAASVVARFRATIAETGRIRVRIRDFLKEPGAWRFYERQSILSKPLVIPVANPMTEALGIFQSDIIIRSALVAALADLRSTPALLDYAFASLPRDAQTRQTYGEKEVDEAKRWFLATEIPVFLNTRMGESKFPCISISLDESSEEENTLGDVHWEPEEDNEATWPALTLAFTPRSYDQALGKMVVPRIVADTLVISPGMVIQDRTGRTHTILDVEDAFTLYIAEGTVADFTDMVLKGAFPSQTTTLESAGFRESFTIGCHAASESVYLTYLHSLVVFCLLRYRQALLEARGFERTKISSSEMMRNENFDREQVYSRFIKLTGFVRQYWPKQFGPKLTSATLQPMRVIGSETLPSDTDPNDSLWVGEDDELDE